MLQTLEMVWIIGGPVLGAAAGWELASMVFKREILVLTDERDDARSEARAYREKEFEDKLCSGS